MTTGVDTSFDDRSDTPQEKDPDKHSPTERDEYLDYVQRSNDFIRAGNTRIDAQ